MHGYEISESKYSPTQLPLMAAKNGLSMLTHIH